MEQVKVRRLVNTVTGMLASDGDGVKLTRIIGSPELAMLDPFLMLDVFKSDVASDYIGGFPEHPHRGFETITYLLNGKMRHKDSEGHEGVIEPGGVQWMTAGSGISHSEMPEQENGLLHGFQFWLNLAADDKLTQPAYQEFSAEQIPVDETDPGVVIKVIVGETDNGVNGAVQARFVKPRIFDVRMSQGAMFKQTVSALDNVFIYSVNGELSTGTSQDSLTTNQLGMFESGEQVSVLAETDVQFIFASAPPLNEPVARGGPFVMNTQAQLRQAFVDFSRK